MLTGQLVIFFLLSFLLSTRTDGRRHSKVSQDWVTQGHGHHTANHNRNGRFFSLFSVVSFPNEACDADDGRNGTCLSWSDCSDKGGSSGGSCALGFGVCCVNSIECDGSSSMNCTYIRNPGYSNGYSTAGSCRIKFGYTSNTCQVRMDIDEFELVGPNTDGVCNTDSLSIPGNNKFSSVCGSTSQTHFYLDVQFPGSASSMDFIFNLGSSSTTERKWNIKLTQICCQYQAPSGCGQYYTGTSGLIKGFNTDATSNTNYLLNLDYGICVRRELNYCQVTFTGKAGVKCSDSFEFPAFPQVFNSLGSFDQFDNGVCGDTYTSTPDVSFTFESLAPWEMYLKTSDTTTGKTSFLDYKLSYQQSTVC